MRNRKLIDGWSRAALVCAVLSTTACAAVLEEFAGDRVADGGPPGVTPPRRLEKPPASPPREGPAKTSPPREDAAKTSTYEVAPAMAVGTEDLARPSFLAGPFLVSRNGRNPVCRPVPRGLTEVLSVPDGAPVDKGVWGIGLAGTVVPVDGFIAADAEQRAHNAFRSGARLAGEGSTCARTPSLSVHFWFWKDSSEPIGLAR